MSKLINSGVLGVFLFCTSASALYEFPFLVAATVASLAGAGMEAATAKKDADAKNHIESQPPFDDQTSAKDSLLMAEITSGIAAVLFAGAATSGMLSVRFQPAIIGALAISGTNLIPTIWSSVSNGIAYGKVSANSSLDDNQKPSLILSSISAFSGVATVGFYSYLVYRAYHTPSSDIPTPNDPSVPYQVKPPVDNTPPPAGGDGTIEVPVIEVPVVLRRR